jgi:hypothetical protein
MGAGPYTKEGVGECNVVKSVRGVETRHCKQAEWGKVGNALGAGGGHAERRCSRPRGGVN